MLHQKVMERVMEHWVRTSHNLRCFEETFGNGFKTTEETRKLKNEQEQILNANGFVYQITTEGKIGETNLTYIFRQKRIKSTRQVLKNWLKTHITQGWRLSSIKHIELQKGTITCQK